MTKSSNNIKIITAIISALFALMTFVTLFLPAFRHQLADNPDVGSGEFKVGDIIKGGLYDYENDEKDEISGELIKYEKLSLKAQEYYELFILLSDNRLGSIFAVCLMLTLICALLMFASSLVAFGSGPDAFWLKMIIALLHLAFTVTAILLLGPLGELVSNDIFHLLNFTVVMDVALIVLLVSSVGFMLSILLGKVLSGEKLFKAKAKK